MIKTSRILSIILTLIIASASWTGAKAQYWEAKEGDHAIVNGIHFLINGFGTATVTNTQYLGEGYGYYTNTVQIPSTITVEGETYTVTGIQEKAFYSCPELKNVQIPSTVSTIGAQAFGESPLLSKIIVDPTNQNFYADNNGILFNKTQTELIFCPKTFSGAYTVPEDVQKIHAFAFNNCKQLTSVVLPNGLKRIEDGAFWGCSNMTSANIPSGLTYLGSDAFRNASSLSSSIVLPSTLSEIGSSAFKRCTSLSNVTIENGVEIIGGSAFVDCSNLKSIDIPNSVYSLGTSAFESAGLTSINIPESITEIQASVFYGCKLTKITLPAGLKSIDAEAFADNGTNIEKVEIPESVISIGNNAFNGTNVKNFYINNIPSKINLNANSPFKATGTSIHVFTLMKSIFENATNWSNYKGHFVADIEITHVESITLDSESMTVLTTKTGKLNATINPEDARVKDVTYTSSNNDIIAIVDAKAGTFIAGAEEGEATITCTANDGTDVFAQCKITVKKSFVPATSVTLNKTNASMEVGNSLKLTATITPANATYKNIIWVSSDEDVAEVSNGTVTAVGPGNATITAISGDGNARAKCSISVTYGTYMLTDGTEYTGEEDYYVKELTYSRVFKNDNWQCLYVPFDMSYNDWKDNFEVAIINNIHQYDDEDDGIIDRTEIEILYQKVGKTIKAHTPCMIRAKKADSNNAQKIIVNNATLKKAESKTLDCSSVTTKFVFHGIYSKLSGSVMVENGYYSMSKGKFAKATDPNGNLNGLRWYLEAIDRTTGESSLAKTGEISIVAIDEDEVTGIANIENGSDNKIVSIFDANGRKMNGFQKGLNIVKYSNGTTKKIMK
jgi:uncharacterized protein YjdB